MRTIAAIPAAALLAGAASGLYVPEPHFLLLYLALSTSVAGAMFGWALHDRVLLVASVSLGFFTAGWLLSSVVWERAWRPPLRLVFERLAHEEREAAAAQGRRMPEDDEAFATWKEHCVRMRRRPSLASLFRLPWTICQRRLRPRRAGARRLRKSRGGGGGAPNAAGALGCRGVPPQVKKS